MLFKYKEFFYAVVLICILTSCSYLVGMAFGRHYGFRTGYSYGYSQAMDYCLEQLKTLEKQ